MSFAGAAGEVLFCQMFEHRTLGRMTIFHILFVRRIQTTSIFF